MQIVALLSVLCQKVFAWHHLATMRDGLLQIIAVMAPLSAAQYAWIVIRRMNSQQPTVV
jgi:cardiolipin synthase